MLHFIISRRHLCIVPTRTTRLPNSMPRKRRSRQDSADAKTNKVPSRKDVRVCVDDSTSRRVIRATLRQHRRRSFHGGGGLRRLASASSRLFSLRRHQRMNPRRVTLPSWSFSKSPPSARASFASLPNIREWGDAPSKRKHEKGEDPSEHAPPLFKDSLAACTRAPAKLRRCSHPTMNTLLRPSRTNRTNISGQMKFSASPQKKYISQSPRRSTIIAVIVIHIDNHNNNKHQQQQQAYLSDTNPPAPSTRSSKVSKSRRVANGATHCETPSVVDDKSGHAIVNKTFQGLRGQQASRPS